jgi:hypothetical protein
MEKLLGVAMIPAVPLSFDALSFDDRDFQAGEEASDPLECRRLASFEFAVRSLVKFIFVTEALSFVWLLASETMSRLKSCMLSSRVSRTICGLWENHFIGRDSGMAERDRIRKLVEDIQVSHHYRGWVVPFHSMEWISAW